MSNESFKTCVTAYTQTFNLHVEDNMSEIPTYLVV